MTANDRQISYWANMLNEAMNDKCEETEHLEERRMNGPAAAAHGTGIDEIADFREKLENGVVEFEFTKRDGTKRHAVGTTSEQIVPSAERRRLDPEYDQELASYQNREAYTIWFWDLEKNSCRCFNTNRFERIIHYERTSRHFDDRVQRVGNIFIHRDADPEALDMRDPEAVQRANEEIGDELTAAEANGDDAGNISGVLFGGTNLDAGDIPGCEFQRGQNDEPILKIIVRKTGHDNDQPYQLRINDLRREIRNRFGVDVKKVIIDGEFNF